MGDWLADEDQELLGEALSLLVSWDDTKDVKGDVGASKAEVEVEAADRRPRQKNVCRERLKQELKELRSSVAQLETQLTTLQHRREMQLRPHLSGGIVLSTAPIWETMARRQFKARKRSEAVNTKLRERLNLQAQAARELFTAIELAVRRHREIGLSATPARRVCLPIDVSQRMSEEEQLRRLHASHSKWQWALSLSHKIQKGQLQFVDIQVIDTDGYAATLELHYSHVYPYPVDVVAKVLWSFLLDETCIEEDGEIYAQDHRTVDDLIIAVFTSHTTMGGEVKSGGKMHGKWVAKRGSVEDGRQHFLTSHWHYELTEFGNELDGVRAEEDSWVRLVDARDIGHSHLIDPLTVLQNVRRLRLQLCDDEPEEIARVHSVIRMFKAQATDELAWIERTIENQLMNPRR